MARKKKHTPLLTTELLEELDAYHKGKWVEIVGQKVVVSADLLRNAIDEMKDSHYKILYMWIPLENDENVEHLCL